MKCWWHTVPGCLNTDNKRKKQGDKSDGESIESGCAGHGKYGKAHARSMMRMENVEIAGLCSSPADDAEAFAREIIWTAGFMMTVSA